MIRPTSRPWQWRAAITPPDWHNIDANLRQRFLSIDAVVENLARTVERLPDAGLSGTLAAPLGPYRNIHHKLSAKFSPILEPIDLSFARREHSVLAHFAYLDSQNSLPPSRRILSDIVEHFTGSGLLRTRAIATDADPAGRHVVFVNPKAVSSQLELLDTFLETSKEVSPAFRAIIALVMITNCHPFPDGNGRAARAFFNALLDQKGPLGRLYLPLKEIAIFSRGGYIIRVRQAEIHGDWAPIADFIGAAGQLWHQHVQGELGRVGKRSSQLA
jgi:Fic/DOC family